MDRTDFYRSFYESPLYQEAHPNKPIGMLMQEFLSEHPNSRLIAREIGVTLDNIHNFVELVEDFDQWEKNKIKGERSHLFAQADFRRGYEQASMYPGEWLPSMLDAQEEGISLEEKGRRMAINEYRMSRR